jgi:hypothetical protein
MKGKPSKDSQFSNAKIGADGEALEQEKDVSIVEQEKAREALLRGRTWLGRECLTYWLFKSESTESVFQFEKEDVTLVFHGKLALKAGGGEVTEMNVKGVTAPYSSLVKMAISRGLLAHVARLKITHGDRVFDATIDAEFFDVKAVKLPSLLSGDEDEKLLERLELVNQLAKITEKLASEFISVRTSKKWTGVVKEMTQWMSDAS